MPRRSQTARFFAAWAGKGEGKTTGKKALRRLCAALCVPLLAALAGGCASQTQQTVTFAVPANEAPLAFTQDDARTGFEIDLANETARRAGLTARFVSVSAPGNEAALTSRKADAVFGVDAGQAGKDMLLTSPYLRDRLVYLVRTDSGVTAAKDLDGKAVGVVSGSAEQTALKKSGLGNVFQDGAADGFVDLNTALLAMEAGQVTAAALYRGEALYTQQSNALVYTVVDAVSESEAFGSAGRAQGLGLLACVAVRRNDARLRNKLEQALAAMQKDGTLATMSKKWFGEDLSIKTTETAQ